MQYLWKQMHPFLKIKNEFSTDICNVIFGFHVSEPQFIFCTSFTNKWVCYHMWIFFLSTESGTNEFINTDLWSPKMKVRKSHRIPIIFNLYCNPLEYLQAVLSTINSELNVQVSMLICCFDVQWMREQFKKTINLVLEL